jgi:hypothetical protein
MRQRKPNMWKKLFPPKHSAEDKAAAAIEMAEIVTRAWPVYRANLDAFLAQIDLLRTIQAPYDYRQINDMFLWGVVAEFLAGRPRLPTDAHSRIVIYLIWYFVNVDAQSLDEARARALAAQALFETTNPFFDGVIEAGAVAYRTGGDRLLINAHANNVQT